LPGGSCGGSAQATATEERRVAGAKKRRPNAQSAARVGSNAAPVMVRVREPPAYDKEGATDVTAGEGTI
jgi:hypothetical protein